jgi:hypothetical protein
MSNSNIYYKRLQKILSSKKRRNTKTPRVPAKYKDEDPRHHSDLFVDEEKKKSIKGLKFRTEKEAKESVKKIKKLYKEGKITFAHAKQAGMAMEQRSRFHAHPTIDIKKANKIWKQFIKTFKKL